MTCLVELSPDELVPLQGASASVRIKLDFQHYRSNYGKRRGFSAVDEVALLRAIELHPDEDTPRLMLADLYDEHGRRGDACDQRLAVLRRRILIVPNDDAVRDQYATVCSQYGRVGLAEFIYDQLFLARRDRDTSLDPVYRDRASKFLQSERGAEPPYPQLLGERLGRILADPVFERGFLDSLEVSLPMWLQYGDEVLAHYPIAEVSVGALFLVQQDENEAWLDGDPLAKRFALAQIEAARRFGDPDEMIAGRYLAPLVRLRWPGVTFVMPNLYIQSGVGAGAICLDDEGAASVTVPPQVSWWNARQPNFNEGW